MGDDWRDLFNNRWLASAVAVIVFGLAPPAIHHSLRGRISTMSTRPMKDLKLKPVAFARYQIDLPEGVVLTNWYQAFQGVGRLKVTRNVTPEAFSKRLQDDADLLHRLHPEGGTEFEQRVDLALPQCHALLYWKDGRSRQAPDIEVKEYYLLGNVMYASEGSIPADPGQRASYFSRYAAAMACLRPRRQSDLPSAPGTCFDGSILLDDPGRCNHDFVSADILWPDRPDVCLTLVVSANGQHPDPPLLTRLRDNDALPFPGVLRSGPRTVGGIAGEEHLERIPEANGTVGHQFIWEAVGLPFRHDHPQIRLDLTTGNGRREPVASSLSDEDALRLWDAVLGSLRWRPTVPPTQPGPTP